MADVARQLPQDASTEVKMISASVFATLNEAWDKFKTENGMQRGATKAFRSIHYIWQFLTFPVTTVFPDFVQRGDSSR